MPRVRVTVPVNIGDMFRVFCSNVGKKHGDVMTEQLLSISHMTISEIRGLCQLVMESWAYESTKIGTTISGEVDVHTLLTCVKAVKNSIDSGYFDSLPAISTRSSLLKYPIWVRMAVYLSLQGAKEFVLDYTKAHSAEEKEVDRALGILTALNSIYDVV